MLTAEKIESIENEVRLALQEVNDPEIPVISVVDLGMITGVKVTDEGFVTVSMTPTFSACPAINLIQGLIKAEVDQLKENRPKLGISGSEVKVNFDVQWNTNMISEEGLKKLKEFGLAPPERYEGTACLKNLQHVDCPFCGSSNTTFKSMFGSTLCRAIHYCNDCKQSFEQFKPV